MSDALEKAAADQACTDRRLNLPVMGRSARQTTHPAPQRDEIRGGVANHVEGGIGGLVARAGRRRRLIDIRAEGLVQGVDLGDDGRATLKARRRIGGAARGDQNLWHLLSPQVEIVQWSRRRLAHALAKSLSALGRLIPLQLA